MVVDMMPTPMQLTNVVHATYVKRVTGLCQARSGRLLDKRWLPRPLMRLQKQ